MGGGVERNEELLRGVSAFSLHLGEPIMNVKIIGLNHEFKGGQPNFCLILGCLFFSASNYCHFKRGGGVYALLRIFKGSWFCSFVLQVKRNF